MTSGQRALAGGALAALWAGVIALAFAAVEPTASLQGTPLLRGAMGFAAAGAAVLACIGAGGALLARFARPALDDDLGWLRALAVGLVVWGLVSLPAAQLLGVRPWVGVVLLGLMAAGWLVRPPVRLPRPTRGELAIGVLFLVPALLALVAPIHDTDELYYHLALPVRFLDEGTLLGGPWMPNGSRPLALHLPWTWLTALGGVQAPRAFHLCTVACLLLATRRRAEAWWGPEAGLAAPLLLLGSTTFLAHAGLAYSDIPAALLVLLAADAALVGALALAALFAGGALAIKYTAAVALAPLLLWLTITKLREAKPRDRARAAGAVFAAAAAALLLVAPWWLRNLIEGLHPLFPFAGWADAGDFPFQLPDKYGLGRDLAATLMLPWNLTVHAEHDSMVFLGRINPAFLALLPPALVAAWRCRRARMAVLVTAGGLLLWSAGAQWLRYLLPVLPLAALAAAAGLARLPRWAGGVVALCWLVGLPANLRPVLAEAVRHAPVALGQESDEAWLERELPSWGALRWVNRHAPSDAHVALLFSWQAALIERPWVLGSVEDHVPTRHLLALHGDNTLEVLRAAGVTHVFFSEIHFLRKSYPFLDASTFDAWFAAPERELEALLEREAVLMTAEGRYQVWKL